MDHTDKTPQEQASSLVSRRQCLKVLAGVPLATLFGVALSPIARFLKPTMQPFNFFQPADLQKAVRPLEFSYTDVPHDWDCVEFTMSLRYTVLGPRQESIRQIPGFVIRVPGEDVVAYSRICPRDGSTLNYMREADQNCGCAGEGQRCCCAFIISPVLVCPCDHTIYDLAQAGRVIAGPGWRAPRRFNLARCDGRFLITGLDHYSIASA